MNLKTEIIYYPAREGTKEDFVAAVPKRFVSSNIKKVVDAKANSATVELNNPIISVFSDGFPQRQFIQDDRTCAFDATKTGTGYTNFEERIEIYAKLTDDAAEDIVGDDNLLFVGQIIKSENTHGKGECKIKLTLSDRSYNILNRIYGNQYDTLTCMEIIQDAVRQKVEINGQDILAYDVNGVLGTGPEYKYLVDVRLFTEGIKGSADTDSVTSVTGKTIVATTATFETDLVAVGDLVKNETNYQTAIVREVISETSLRLSKNIFSVGENITVSNGFIQDWRPDGTVFPDIQFGLSNKPVYEWISTLVQLNKTNTQAEIDAGNNPCKRPFKFYVDGRNRLHVFYPDDTPSIEMVVGQAGAVGDDTNEYHITKSDYKKGIFDVINFIIFRAGRDMNGRPINWYAQDPTSGGPIVKDSFRSFVTVAEDMKKAEYYAGNTTANDDGTYDYPSSYPMTPVWGDNSVANDSEYNTEFRRVARILGRGRAFRIINQTANPRWDGKTILWGYNFNASDLMKYSDFDIGINKGLLRINTVQHNISKSGWHTTLTNKEDLSETS